MARCMHSVRYRNLTNVIIKSVSDTTFCFNFRRPFATSKTPDPVQADTGTRENAGNLAHRYFKQLFQNSRVLNSKTTVAEALPTDSQNEVVEEPQRSLSGSAHKVAESIPADLTSQVADEPQWRPESHTELSQYDLAHNNNELVAESIPADFPSPVVHEPQKIPQSKSALSTQVDIEFLDTIAPPIPKSFNLAAYVDKSEVLQELMKLGVDLSKVEQRGSRVYQSYLNLDFEKDVKPRIQFLNDHGIPANELGVFISRNPEIFQNDLDHLETRIEYLKSRGFHSTSITRILSHCPNWLNFNTKAIDSRLGYLQKTFNLSNKEVRVVISMQPKLGIISQDIITRCIFAFREEMGFDEAEIKELLLRKPKLWLQNHEMITERFLYLQNEVGASHQILLQFPGALLSRKFIVQQRHEYLKKLGRAQFDPLLPNYVSLKALVSGTDAEFCQKVAKTFVADFNEFLKTM